MTAYLVRRSLQMLVVLFVSSVAIYGILNLAPGGPLSGLKMVADSKSRMSQKDIDKLAAMLGIDKPVQVRYVAWITGDDWLGRLNPKWEGKKKGILRGDFGESWRSHRSVNLLIKERLPNTITLMLTAAVVSILVAIPVGVYSAVNQYSRLDYVFTFFTFMGIAIPAFWFGLMVIILFGYKMHDWVGLPKMPTSGVKSLVAPREGTMLHSIGGLIGAENVAPGGLADRLVHLAMPAMVLSLLSMASWTRYVRSQMLEVLRQDYVRTAKAKGLSNRSVISKHALRNALIPLVTIVTFEIPAIFSGAVLTETIFSWPGMGLLYIDALRANDWPVVQAFLIISAVLVVVATLSSDILYTVVDPRIRY